MKMLTLTMLAIENSSCRAVAEQHDSKGPQPFCGFNDAQDAYQCSRSFVDPGVLPMSKIMSRSATRPDLWWVKFVGRAQVLASGGSTVGSEGYLRIHGSEPLGWRANIVPDAVMRHGSLVAG